MRIPKQEHCISYYDDGKVAVTKSFENGRYVVRHYHKNGRIKREIPSKDEREHGTIRQWNEDGHFLGSYEMHQGTGVAIEWYENGAIKSKVTMVDGFPNGRIEVWDEEGQSSSALMLNGELTNIEAYREACALNPKLPQY